MKSTKQTNWLAFFLLTICLFLAACHSNAEKRTDATATIAEHKPTTFKSTGGAPKRYGLTIYGYNYTDLAIDSFSVGYSGGGNLSVSSPGGGGGSSVCCYSFYTPLLPDEQIKVRWLSAHLDGGYWCEQNVPLKGPVPTNPHFLEVHFYQDGHVELAITEQASQPRLKLERANVAQRYEKLEDNINNDTKYATCERWISIRVTSRIADKAYQYMQHVVAQERDKNGKAHMQLSNEAYNAIEDKAYASMYDAEIARVKSLSPEAYLQEVKESERYLEAKQAAKEKAAHERFLRDNVVQPTPAVKN